MNVLLLGVGLQDKCVHLLQPPVSLVGQTGLAWTDSRLVAKVFMEHLGSRQSNGLGRRPILMYSVPKLKFQQHVTRTVLPAEVVSRLGL